jgi:hypothetical protein
MSIFYAIDGNCQLSKRRLAGNYTVVGVASLLHSLITPREVFSVIASGQSMCRRGQELLSCTRGVEEFVGGNPSPLTGAGKWRQVVLLSGPARIVGKVEACESERGLVDGLASELGLGRVATGGEGQAEVGTGGKLERLLEVVSRRQVYPSRPR